MKIFCDYDSVLVNFTASWLKWIHKTYNINIRTIQMSNFNYLEEHLGSHANEFWKTKGFYGDVKVIPEAPNFLSELQGLVGKENVFIVTSSHPVTQPEKHEHIHKNFSIADENIIHARVKHPHTKGGVLIDDHILNCVNHSLNNKAPSIVFDYKGEYGWSKFTNYNDVESLQKVQPFIVKCRSYESVIRQLNNYIL
jgi:5'(3')-deoxyribonucleotidase